MKDYVEIVKEANTCCSTELTLFANPVRTPVERDVRRGVGFSSHLFTTGPELECRKISWKVKSVLMANGTIVHALRLNSHREQRS